MVSGSSNSQAKSASVDNGPPEFPNKNINKRIAVISTLAAVGLVLSARLDLGVSLKDLSAAALPYEEVLSLKFVWSFIYWLFCLYIHYFLGGVLGSCQWKAHCCGVLRRLVRSVPGIGSRGLQS